MCHLGTILCLWDQWAHPPYRIFKSFNTRTLDIRCITGPKPWVIPHINFFIPSPSHHLMHSTYFCCFLPMREGNFCIVGLNIFFKYFHATLSLSNKPIFTLSFFFSITWSLLLYINLKDTIEVTHNKVYFLINIYILNLLIQLWHILIVTQWSHTLNFRQIKYLYQVFC